MVFPSKSGGKVTQNLPRFLPIQNVVAFISIWTRIPNTLRRPQQFSTLNWDTTTEVVTLYQVLETGEILTYPGDSKREAAKLDISSCYNLDSNCWTAFPEVGWDGMGYTVGTDFGFFSVCTSANLRVGKRKTTLFRLDIHYLVIKSKCDIRDKRISE